MSRGVRHVAIAGAGIAGLAAAIALARLGLRVSVFEQAPRLAEIGAGLQLSPNATRILARLDVLRRLTPVAAMPKAIALVRARDLRRLAAVPLGTGAAARWGAPYLTVHRADLHGALLATAGVQPGIEIITGATVRDAALHAQGVTLSLDNGGAIDEVRCDLAIGADGVWSTIRGLGSGERLSRFTGHVAFRAMVSGTGAAAVSRDEVTAFLHPGFHLVAYPVRAGDAINLVAVRKGDASARTWSTAAASEAVLAGLTRIAPDLRALVEQARPWTSWPIHEVEGKIAWTHPAGLALVGDAAHAMTPYAAQGAAMAIEDAEALALAVDGHRDDVAAALDAYEDGRRARVARVRKRGAFNRFAWHAAGPVAMARDLVLARRKPEQLAADLDWLYGYDAASPSAAAAR